MGLAIFTKIPALAIAPLAVFLVHYGGHGKNLKLLALWLIPVVLIPSIWLAYSVSVGQFDLWLKDVLWQAHRHRTVVESITALFQIDPVLLILGLGGVIFAAIRRDLFPVLWAGSFVIFFTAIGWVGPILSLDSRHSCILHCSGKPAKLVDLYSLPHNLLLTLS